MLPLKMKTGVNMILAKIQLFAGRALKNTFCVAALAQNAVCLIEANTYLEK